VSEVSLKLQIAAVEVSGSEMAFPAAIYAPENGFALMIAQAELGKKLWPPRCGKVPNVVICHTPPGDFYH